MHSFRCSLLPDAASGDIERPCTAVGAVQAIHNICYTLVRQQLSPRLFRVQISGPFCRQLEDTPLVCLILYGNRHPKVAWCWSVFLHPRLDLFLWVVLLERSCIGKRLCVSSTRCQPRGGSTTMAAWWTVQNKTSGFHAPLHHPDRPLFRLRLNT